MKNIHTTLKRIAIAATVYVSFITGLNAQIYNINTPTSWDALSAPTTPIHGINIYSGGSLTTDNCTLIMDISASIIVYSGGYLEMHSTVSKPDLDGYLWEGIVLNGDDANLIMAESRIERAKTGVRHVSGDCLIQIEDSYFYNCAKGIEFNSYPSNNYSYITNTTFEVAQFTLAYNNLCFNQNLSNVYFSSHISAYDSFVPAISGCQFLNSHSEISDYKYAIDALYSEISVCGYNNMNSLFRNFDCAIRATDNYTHTLNVNDSDFEGNATGIAAWYVDSTFISCCSFSLGNFDDANYPYREGIVMNVCKNYHIMGNYLYKDGGAVLNGSTGIYIKNTGGLNGYVSCIYGNTIQKLTEGIVATGNNRSYPSSPVLTDGLQISCNDIENCRYGIYCGGLIGEPQSVNGGSAGNIFHNNGYDIYNTSSTLTYYYDGTAPTVYNVNIAYTHDNYCSSMSHGTCLIIRESVLDDTLSGEVELRGNSSTREKHLEKLVEKYSDMKEIEPKYALIEVLKAMDNYESAEFELRQILYSGKLTENGYSEYKTYKELFYLEKTMREQGRDWKSMTEEERTKLNRIAKRGYGRAQHMAAVIEEFHNDAPETKQTSFGWGDFPWTCMKMVGIDTISCPPIYSDELKFVLTHARSTCACSGDTIFIQGIYTPANNEYPPDAPTSIYGRGYDGNFSLLIHYSDPSMNVIDEYTGWETCLTDKQCQDINLQLTFESDFATGHYNSGCATTWVEVDGALVANNKDDSLACFSVQQPRELATSGHDHGEGTVTITWTGFDGTPRQHVLYFIIDDHFYIDFVGYGVDENEDVSANGVRVYPNPTDGIFAIEAENITKVEIFDLAGQKVLTDKSGSQTINAGNLTTGVYFLKVETQNGTKYGKLMRK